MNLKNIFLAMLLASVSLSASADWTPDWVKSMFGQEEAKPTKLAAPAPVPAKANPANPAASKPAPSTGVPVADATTTPANAIVPPPQNAASASCTPAKVECEKPKAKAKVKHKAKVQAPKETVVNKVVETTEVTKELVVKDVVICKSPDGRTHSPKMENGKPVCETEMVNRFVVQPEVKVLQPKIETPQVPVYVPPARPAYVPQGTAPAPQSATSCVNCGPAVKLDHKVARTDGRCVVAFKDLAGTIHLARFDTKRGTNLLVAARVDNEAAEWNHAYTPTYVGYIANGEKKTVELSGTPDCEVVYQAISNPKVLAWTGPRLGLTPDCIPVGRM